MRGPFHRLFIHAAFAVSLAPGALLFLGGEALAKKQSCDYEKVKQKGGGSSDPKKQKEDTCKQKKKTFVPDDQAKEKCVKEPKPDEACCCGDESGGDDKKDGGGGQGGGSPQQSPQQQGDQNQNPSPSENAATSPTPNSSINGGNGAETSKADNKSGSSQAGGAINFDKPTKPSTVVSSPGTNRGPGGGLGPQSSASLPFPEDAGARGGGGMMGMIGGGGGSAGGALGTSGAPAGKNDSPTGTKTDASANPYEVSTGGGGKLGAPKGYSKGGESDSAVEASAKDRFNKDFTAPPASGGNSANPAATEEDGYSLFKMVSKRYMEVRRKGWL